MKSIKIFSEETFVQKRGSRYETERGSKTSWISLRHYYHYYHSHYHYHYYPLLPPPPLLLQPFNGLFYGTTWVSRYQKSKNSLDLNEARENGGWDAVASAGPHANNLHLAPDR